MARRFIIKPCGKGHWKNVLSFTFHENLWSGNPLWLADAGLEIPCAPLKQNIKVDVAIIGSGVSGAFLAEELSHNGFSVAMIDRRPPMHGSTAASTALLHYDIDMPLIKLTRMIGHDNAARAWRRAKQSLENLAERTRALSIACDLESRDALYLPGSILDAEGLYAESAARRAIGVSAHYLDAKVLERRFGLHRAAALCSPDNFAAHPRKLVAGYLRTAMDRGVRIFAPDSVTDVKSGPRGVVMTTKNHYRIESRHAVFATGYELMKGVALKNTGLYSSWAFATRPQPENLWPERVHIWEASDPYLYIRTTPEGRVLCGGEDETFSDEHKRNALMPQKIETLRKKLHELFPLLDTAPVYAWAGCFGETKTGLPMIGPVRGLENCYAILAFGGNGMTFSRMAAEMIGAMVKGEKAPDADLFPIR